MGGPCLWPPLGNEVTFTICRDSSGASELLVSRSPALGMGGGLAGAWDVLGRLSLSRWNRNLKKLLLAHAMSFPSTYEGG